MFNAWPASVDWLCDLSWLGWEGPVFLYITCFCNSSSWWADNIAIMCMDVWCTTGLLTLVVASFGWDKRVQCSYITCFWISSSWWADGQRTNVAVQDVWCTAGHRTDWGGQLINCTHHATVISNRVRSTEPCTVHKWRGLISLVSQCYTCDHYWALMTPFFVDQNQKMVFVWCKSIYILSTSYNTIL